MTRVSRAPHRVSFSTHLTLVLLAAFAAASAPGRVAQAATIVVTTTVDELITNGRCSLREAVRAANLDQAVDACATGNGADTIQLEAGTYTLGLAGRGEDEGMSGDIDVMSHLTITGATSDTTILDGDRLDRVLHITNADVKLHNLTIRNGFAQEENRSGSGVFHVGGSLQLSDSTITRNQFRVTCTDCEEFFEFSGGLFFDGRVVIITNSSITENKSAGIFLSHGFTTISHSEIVDNDGDGVSGYSDNSPCSGFSVITNSSISGNNFGICGDSRIISSTIIGNQVGVYADILSIEDSVIGNNKTGVIASEAAINNSSITNNRDGVYVNGQLNMQGSQVSNNAGLGISIDGGENTLDETDISNNNEGGVYNGGKLTVLNSTITENTARLGGGIYNDYSSSLTISGSTIARNTARIGGGIYSGNAESYYQDANVIINGSTLAGNKAEVAGGGIANSLAMLRITNSTISGNESMGNGGGIYNYLGGLELNNNTIVYNVADSDNDGAGSGGGISHISTADRGWPPEEKFRPFVKLGNTILAGNSASAGADCSGVLQSRGHNLIHDLTNCTVAGQTTGNRYGVEPGLGPLEQNASLTKAHAPLPGSPAINTGSPAPPGSDSAACEDADQRFSSRRDHSRCDIGAYESDYLEPIPATISTLSPLRVTAGGGRLQLVVTGAGFVQGTQVLWQGEPRPTTFISPSQLRVEVPATDVATASRVAVDLVNPGERGYAISGHYFTVDPVKAPPVPTRPPPVPTRPPPVPTRPPEPPQYFLFIPHLTR